ncbi:ATP-binding protein [Actibacterium sp. 188UL27-1]|uniref:ATP-binding protein n=1 Tax=Actibacterium sp. 188UL27-1 TaxID=2786961 RepID=UPI00195C247D|nr:ATP-binding protein [Actibacterium sp. 188UL27-1]MBM7069219.1 HAMP domain-containing protein [Actibacterium sp. 188UL27-1]
MSERIVRKWRPSLALVIAAVCLALVALPVVGVLAARLTSNQFVRETERSLLAQAVIYAEAYAIAYAAYGDKPRHGRFLTAEQKEARAEHYTPITPSLSVFQGRIRQPRPDGTPLIHPVTAPYDAIDAPLSDLAKRIQKSNLAGYLALDAFGGVIAGSSDERYSLANVPEVQDALRGEVRSVLRSKTKIEFHPLNSISRNTRYRVFVAMPVVVQDRVVGAVYLSRTPLDLQKFVYQERMTLLLVGAIMIAGSVALGGLLWRLVSRPIRGLREQSQQVAQGERSALEPLGSYGVREVADLGGSILSMSAALGDRSRTVETYTNHVTHELKSPVTSIIGAAELLETGGAAMPQERQARLVRTISTEGQRMTTLLGRLRELARAKTVGGLPGTDLGEAVRAVAPGLPNLVIDNGVAHGTEVPLSEEGAEIVLTQLMRNAAEHGAATVRLSWSDNTLTVEDDGSGVSAANRDRLTEPFFTTRRDGGGTGMGLAIVTAVLEGRGARLDVGATNALGGATFHLIF